MSADRFPRLPSNDSVADVVTVAVSAWLTLAAAAMWVDGGAPAPQEPRRAVLMEEAAPASPTPLPVAAAAPQVRERIVVEARRLAAVPSTYEKMVVVAPRERA